MLLACLESGKRHEGIKPQENCSISMLELLESPLADHQAT